MDYSPSRTVGASIFPPLNIRGGDLAGAYELCGSDEERIMLDAWMACFRIEPLTARALASDLYKRQLKPRLKLGCGTVLAAAAIHMGDTLAWKELLSELAALPEPGDMRVYKEFAVALLNIFMHGRGVYPDWLERGTFAGLPDELFPAARMMYVRLLYIKWKEVELLSVAEPLLAECRREKSDIFEIYLRIDAAIAYKDHGKAARAKAHIDEAAALAMPMGIISPFAENRRPMPRLMDDCLREKYPEELAVIRRRTQPFLDNWMKLYNELWPHPMSGELTLREFEACSLASRGMEVNEIAKRMGISKASVRKYLNVAYHKLGVKDKMQISRLVHP